jgi:hypothetical protein
MSVHPREKKRGSHWTDFHENFGVLLFSKTFREDASFVKI